MQGAQINFSSIFSLFRIQCPFDNVHKNNSVVKGKSFDSFLANNIINFFKLMYVYHRKKCDCFFRKKR